MFFTDNIILFIIILILFILSIIVLSISIKIIIIIIKIIKIIKFEISIITIILTPTPNIPMGWSDDLALQSKLANYSSTPNNVDE